MSRTPQNNVPTVAIALGVAFMLAMAFMMLISIVIPGAGLMILAFLGLGLMFFAQYFIWGKWLYRYVAAQELKKETQELERISNEPKTFE